LWADSTPGNKRDFRSREERRLQLRTTKRLPCATATGSQLKEWPLSPELETLDQLLGGDLRLEVVAQFFPSHEEFEMGVIGLLSCGDIVLLAGDEVVPSWRWKELLTRENVPAETEFLSLRITTQGVRKIK
jgi:hypothetical protein